MRKNLTYLAKSEQYLMIKGAERIRTFDMGQVPKKAKAGRPRAEAGMNETSNDSSVDVLPDEMDVNATDSDASQSD
ncbi:MULTISPECIES: hypothetical protein [Burkholderia]|uniref:hypothetical protein n=1 Tax=Burkholderia TaxID=32008 RepID=UPI000ABC2B56|nr:MULTISPECIES: hypothetical protein [Burkholderia]